MLVLLLACAAAPEDSGPAVLSSTDGHYTVTLATDPAPPVVGETTLLADAPGVTSLALEGAMAGMDHGLGADPVVTGGDGAFEAVVVFSMSGTWELTLTLDGEAGADTLVTDVEVR